METKETKKKREGKKSRGVSAGIVIGISLVLMVCFYIFILGDGSNFENGDNSNHPLPGNYWGIVYKGGPVVVTIMALLLTTFVLSVERWFALSKARGKGNLLSFVFNVKKEVEAGNMKAAEELCAKQEGSVAAIVSAGVKKYQDMETTTTPLSKEQKILAIQKDIEEATALELPTMQQNLPVIATISTLGTLLGLLGTVIGMIRAFSALATTGAPDSVALAAGISEALVNTALGIATGAVAIISYSFFTGKIDDMTYAVEEMGFSIGQTFVAKHT